MVLGLKGERSGLGLGLGALGLTAIRRGFELCGCILVVIVVVAVVVVVVVVLVLVLVDVAAVDFEGDIVF